MGDRVVTREPHRLTGTVNGDTWVVASHRSDGRIDMVRDRDAARVLWDPRENPALDHGYAATSYRGQGRTVDAAYVLATSAGSQRGLYVDVTRARQDVLVAYGRDELLDFGALLNVAATSRAKLTVASLERDLQTRQGADAPKREPETLSPAVRDIFDRSEIFAESMRKKILPTTEAECVEGMLAWK